MKTRPRFVCFGIAVAVLVTWQLSPAPAATLAYWRFEGTGVPLFADSASTNTLNSPATSGVSATSAGDLTQPSGTYASFSGSNNGLRTVSNLNLSAANQLTIEFFVRMSATHAVDIMYDMGTVGSGYNRSPGGLTTYYQ